MEIVGHSELNVELCLIVLSRGCRRSPTGYSSSCFITMDKERARRLLSRARVMPPRLLLQRSLMTGPRRL